MFPDPSGAHSTGRGGGAVSSHLNSPVCVVISDVHRFVPATYLLCCSKRDASVRQPARTRDELDVLQLGDIRRAAGVSNSGRPNRSHRTDTPRVYALILWVRIDPTES